MAAYHDSLWGLPPAALQLRHADVHVWRASLDQLAPHIRLFGGTLTAEEQRRSEQFYFEQDRQRFIIGRGLLRTILASYMGTEPGRLQFRYGAHGKPALAADRDREILQFNLAHSHGL